MQVQMSVDIDRLIDGLRNTFTSRLNTISELLQNARRAGATRVRILRPDPSTLVIEDDGKGIEDFAALISIAGSAWSQDVARTEHPYGIGFLSALLCCERIEVESGHWILRAHCEDLLRSRTATLEPVPTSLTGTRITLHRHTLDSRVDIEIPRLVSGFPLRVWLDDTELSAPNADRPGGSMAFEDTPIGRVALTLDTLFPTLYLQGLRLRMTCGVSGYGDTVVHLDPAQFHGRFPDRENLVEEAQAVKRIWEQIRAMRRARLLHLKQTMPAEEFVSTHAETCRRLGCLDVLADVPYLPGEWFVDWSGASQLGYAPDGSDEPWGDGLFSREEVIERGVFSEDDIIAQREDNGFRVEAYAKATRALILRSVVRGIADRPGHWLHGHVLDPSIELRINGAIGHAMAETDAIGSVVVVACESYTLTHPERGAVTISDGGLFTYSPYGTFPERPWLLDTAVMPMCDPEVALQLTNYWSENAEFSDPEACLDQASKAIRKAYLLAAGTSTESFLLTVLRDTFKVPDVVSGVFAVSIVNGRITGVSKAA